MGSKSEKNPHIMEDWRRKVGSVEPTQRFSAWRKLRDDITVHHAVLSASELQELLRAMKEEQTPTVCWISTQCLFNIAFFNETRLGYSAF